MVCVLSKFFLVESRLYPSHIHIHEDNSPTRTAYNINSEDSVGTMRLHNAACTVYTGRTVWLTHMVQVACTARMVRIAWATQIVIGLTPSRSGHLAGTANRT